MKNDLMQAKKLVNECLNTQTTYLDLGNCGITNLNDLPELFECTQLETLILSNKWLDNNEKQYLLSRNKGPKNKIEYITQNIKRLTKLKKIVICGAAYFDFNKYFYSDLWSTKDLYYLKSLTQLSSLDIRSNQISDISFLKDLTRLSSLDLGSNQISDISFLKDLTQLSSLYLSSNQISDYSYLKDLTQLSSLDLRYNQISDISFLKDLTQLSSLDLRYNQISDISFLKDLTQLSSLDLSSNQIPDISFLKDLTRLSSLDLGSNQISDISFLKDLTQLSRLYLSSNQISDYSYLKDLTQLSSLNLSSNQISDYSYLKDLTQLSSLNLGSNQISDISFLKDLTQLSRLYLSSNQISDISFLKDLTQLSRLYLSDNQISDYSYLKDLTQLRSLDLRYNQIPDISFLKDLTRLRSLDLGSNQISDISYLKDLTQLSSLDLGSNQISDISYLKDLTQLRSLDLGLNQISDISFLKDLTQLRSLDLGSNQISDISFLKDLTQLSSLYLGSNQISDISFLKDLTQLSSLDLSSNQIQFIPEFIFRLKDGNNLVDALLHNNPVTNPPIETIKQGKEAVFEWFKSERAKFNEIKIILIGEPDSGKTSLIKRLKFDDFNKNEPQTDGVNIVDIDFAGVKTFRKEKSLHGIKGRFWDFGGQEIMSATHRIFLRSRSIYLLLLQARDDKANEKQVRDWIKQIKSTGGDSPIIVVANKMDINPSFDFLNQYAIKKDFNQVKDFIKISCAKNENIDLLKNKLAEIIPESGYFDSEVDVRVIKLKDLIKEETKKGNYISEKTFIDLCNCNEVNLRNQELRRFAIDFLDKIGIVSYFDKIKTSEYYVLDPNWVTTGLYRILTSKSAANRNGRIAISDLEYILNNETTKTKKYHPFTEKVFKYEFANERSFIVEILCRYKLAFKLNDDEFIITSLLNANPDNTILEMFYNSDTLDFIFEYDSLPPNIISELLVEFHRSGYLAEYWRTGGVIEKANVKALVSAGNNRVRITILSDNSREGRDLMIYSRAVIEMVNKDLPFPPTKLIPIPGSKSDTVEYQILLNRLKKGKKIYIYNQDKADEREFDIGELLDGIPAEIEIEQSLRRLESKAEKIERNTEQIKSQLNEQLEYLLSLEINSNFKKAELISAIEDISSEQRERIYQEMLELISHAFELHQNDMDEKLKTIFDDLKKSDSISSKLELSVPLLNLVGIKFKTELDIKNWCEKMYKKYELQIFKLFGYI